MPPVDYALSAAKGLALEVRRKRQGEASDNCRRRPGRGRERGRRERRARTTVGASARGAVDATVACCVLQSSDCDMFQGRRCSVGDVWKLRKSSTLFLLILYVWNAISSCPPSDLAVPVL